jgi:hypothetical protein
VRIRLLDPAANPRFDDLPWHVPLADWEHPRLVDMPAGLHRHVVRFVEYGGQIFALKELPPRLAEREYRLLRTLNDRELPVVAVVAIVDERGDPDPVLVTRYLHYALPFRHLFAERRDPELADELVESLATLLARLHVAGFYWGDASLSNAVFRRDELHLSGYALDTETGELHERMSDGQRRADVELAVVNIAGGLADLAAAGQLPGTLDPFELAPQVAVAYERIWDELGGASSYDPGDPVVLDERLERLHELGFGVREAVISGDAPSGGFTFRPVEIVDGHARRELERLTGIVAREHQARRLLGEIDAFRTERRDLPGLTAREAGHRWLVEVYDRVLAAIPSDVAGKLERPQLFIEVLDHAAAGPDAPSGDVVDAARRYVADVLRRRRHERTSATWAATPAETADD